MRPFILLTCLLVMLGCEQSASPLPSPSTATAPAQPAGRLILLLDNKGGVSHGGFQLTLHEPDQFIEKTYSDIVGDEHYDIGKYQLADGVLTLQYEDGRTRELIRFKTGKDDIWITPDDQTLLEAGSDKREQIIWTALREQPLPAAYP